MQDIEPFYGWLDLYAQEMDPNSPFHETLHNEFFYDKAVYNYLAHPLWDEIGSESLLVKILFADYEQQFAIIELMGVWNDLFENDFKLFAENCLTFLMDAGIRKFIFICENVLHIYLDADDYYQAVQEEIEEGWLCLIRPREHVLEDLRSANIDRFFILSEKLDALHWRKLRPWELFEEVRKLKDER